MTEEILSEPESKPLGDDGGPGALQAQARSSDGGDGAGVAGDGGEERWKRERWTRQESMALVSAMKQLEEDSSATSTGGDAKWKSISQICSAHSVQRTSVQCRKRWNTLLAAYKKIKDWERRNGMESYWAMGGLDCKTKKLPAGFDEDIWKVMNSFLAGRAGMSPRLFPYKVDDLQVEPTRAVPVRMGPIPIAPMPVAPVPVAPIPAPLLIQPMPLPLPDLQRGKRERFGDAPRKRKRPARQEIRQQETRQETNSVPEPEPKKPQKLEEQNAGSQRCGFEGLDPLTQFLSSFLEKSLESFERNSELNRNLRREQGENLVAVLGSLSSAVRDLVHSSVLHK